MSQESNVPPPPPPPPASPPPGPPPASPPPGPPPSEGGNRTLMLVLCYLGLLALIPLLVEKDDAEVQWHAKNGLLLMLASIGIYVIWAVFGMVVDMACVGCVFTLTLSAGILAVHVMAIVKAVGGERLMIPMLSDLVDKL